MLTPALLGAPGAALVTLTKVDDLLLSFTVRSREDRPCLVLDPFGLAAGLPELVWDPVAGCVDSMVAERRAKAFTAGTVKGAVAGGHGMTPPVSTPRRRRRCCRCSSTPQR
jgi:type IV secretion system protein VirD4